MNSPSITLNIVSPEKDFRERLTEKLSVSAEHLDMLLRQATITCRETHPLISENRTTEISVRVSFILFSIGRNSESKICSRSSRYIIA